MSKPIIVNQIELKAPINSPVLTGTPKSTTPASGDNSTRIATTAFITSSINNNNTKYVKKAGDTMTGNLVISIPDKTSGSAGPIIYRMDDTTNNDYLQLGYSADGNAQGLYSKTVNHYWNYINKNGNIILRLPRDGTGTYENQDSVKNVVISKSTTIEHDFPARLAFEVAQIDNNITTASAYIAAYDDHDANKYGLNLVISGTSNVILGSGESAEACYTNVCKGSAAEDLYLTSDNSIYFYTNCNTWANHTTAVKIDSSGKLWGAVWNDYAEFRRGDVVASGRCVIERGNDTLTLATERMQPGASIVSDTFGFSIGHNEVSDDPQIPIAVSGRVLAYPYESREEFRKNIGHPVCSGPNGTVSIMIDEEYRDKGYCAIGTISAVPDYEEWGQGHVKVDDRVWIKVL